MRLPLAMLLLAAGCCLSRAESPLAHIKVAAPTYCSEISGNTKIEIVAPGFSTVEAKCWKQGEGQGTDASLGTVALNSDGKGSFDFPADEFPHGPITIRISGKNPLGADNCYLQLYNKGGVSWNEGLPANPPAAKGMKLVFSDDFDGPLSISSTDPKARYYDHKPPNGSQDFSTIPFRGFDEPNNPFAQVGTYLRIRADANKNSAGHHLVAEKRRHRLHCEGAVLFRVPIHRAKCYRHLARILAHDRLHGRAHQGPPRPAG